MLASKYPKDLPAFTSLGYQDALALLDGKLEPSQAIQRTKFAHHRYIRSQLTWFRKMKNIEWVDVGILNREKIAKKVERWLAE